MDGYVSDARGQMRIHKAILEVVQIGGNTVQKQNDRIVVQTSGIFQGIHCNVADLGKKGRWTLLGLLNLKNAFGKHKDEF